MKLRYTPMAILDLQEIRDYIRDVLQNPEGAQNVLKGIARSCALLKNQPHMGAALRKKFNRELEGYAIISGKYIIVYEVSEIISILRVLDSRTDYLRALMNDGSTDE